jgi:hypothetical protein|tara:strand:- start:128 stop:382 length:255 start_codon:yes stop_codon:yes gene_type:complete
MVEDSQVSPEGNLSPEDVSKSISKFKSEIVKLNEKVTVIQEECKHLEYDVKSIRGTPIQVKKICKVCEMDLGFPTKEELKKAGY